MSMALTAGDETGKKIGSSGNCDYYFEEVSATSCHHLLVHGAHKSVSTFHTDAVSVECTLFL